MTPILEKSGFVLLSLLRDIVVIAPFLLSQTLVFWLELITNQNVLTKYSKYSIFSKI